MPGIMVPKARAETPVGGNGADQPFPEGSFIGTVEEVRTRAFPDWIQAGGNRGYASSDGDILSIQLGQNKALDEGAGGNVGNRKYFVDFVIRDGDESVEAGPGIPAESWQMQKSAASLANLALALGLTDEVEFEGQEMTVTAEDFLSQLQSEDLNGTKVGFTIYHRNWKSKDGTKSGTEAVLKEFFTAV